MTGNRVIAVYVTGHGFGHAVRVAEVLRILLVRRTDLVAHVRGAVPPRLFPAADGRIVFHPIETDVGLAQPDGLTIDFAATLERLDAFEASWPSRLRSETRWLEATRARLVLGDVPPISFAAAAAAAVPGLALGNFSWDWIYRSYATRDARFAAHAERAADAYRRADLLLRLPFHGEMSAFRRIEDLPLVARRSELSQSEARAALGLPSAGPIVLLSFGGLGFGDFDAGKLGKIGAVRFLATERYVGTASNLVTFAESDLDYTTFLRASDAVISKPGFGIVAACLANGVRVLYTSRGEFPEYPILVEALERHGTARFVAPEALRHGDFREPLEELLSKLVRASDLPANGAEVAASVIEEWL